MIFNHTIFHATEPLSINKKKKKINKKPPVLHFMNCSMNLPQLNMIVSFCISINFLFLINQLTTFKGANKTQYNEQQQEQQAWEHNT